MVALITSRKVPSNVSGIALSVDTERGILSIPISEYFRAVTQFDSTFLLRFLYLFIDNLV